MNERVIFEAALEIADPSARKAFVEKSCAGNSELRSRVAALLKSHETAGSFLDVPAIRQLPAELHPKTIVVPTSEIDDDESDQDHGQPDVSFLQPSGKPGSIGTLGHYEVLEILGHGSFGIVFKAFDEVLHRHVAIKVMNPQLAATSPPRKRFLREARAAAAICHDNIVQVYSVEEQPLPYLVMEYIQGQTLQQKLAGSGPLDLAEVLHLARQIASGLAAAHAMGLIHRDIKPGNILIEQGVEQRVKITDFGLARAADDASLTRTGVISGTPMYMAPEQALGQALDHRSDLFSLGSVIYVMASGRPPFRASNMMAVLKRVTEDTPRPLREIIPEIPTWLVGIVNKLHAKQPERRFNSAKEVADLLSKCLADVQANRPVELALGDEPSTSVMNPLVADVGKSVRGSERRLSASEGMTRRAWPTIAAAALILLAGLGITEATGVTELTSTVIRVASGSGTLVIEVNDPGVKVTIDGEEVQIQGAGVEQVTLKPGQYKVAAVKDGVGYQQLVTITRGEKEVVRVTMDGIGDSPSVTAPSHQRKLAFELPGFDAWVNELQQLPAEDQLQAVSKKLQELNPGFDGDLWGQAGAREPAGIQNGEVLRITIYSDAVFDLSPLRALRHLNSLHFESSTSAKGQLADLRPLVGLPLTRLSLLRTRVTDLSPLKDLPLGILGIMGSPVSDLAPLSGMSLHDLSLVDTRVTDLIPLMGMPLTQFSCSRNKISDLSPLRGMKLINLSCNDTTVSDLSPLMGMPLSRLEVAPLPFADLSPIRGMPLTEIRIAYEPERDAELLRSMKTLEMINGVPVADFWKEMQTAWHGWPADAPQPAIAPFDAEQAKKHQEEWAAYLKVPVEYTNSLGMKFRLIPPGEFLMGSTPEEIAATLVVAAEDEDWKKHIRSEAPQHKVILTRPIYLGVHEVTQADYEQIAQTNPAHYSATGAGQALVQGMKTDRFPVEMIDRDAAVRFCAKLSEREQLEPSSVPNGISYRLPSEAQWEFACRAGTATRYWIGDGDERLPEAGWYFPASGPRTHAVGELKSNPFGLFDTHGNVWEWVQDEWEPAYYEQFLELPAVNPQGSVAGGAWRVTRSGVWEGFAAYSRSSSRGIVTPKERTYHIGFRIALPVDAVKQALPQKPMTANPDRAAAEWVLSVGGTIRVDNVVNPIQKIGRLPSLAFELRAVKLDGPIPEIDEGLLAFRGCRNLVTLELGSTNITDVGLANFQDCKKLRYLVLQGTNVSDAGLAHFRGCPELGSLQLNGTRVRGEGLQHFADCEHITTLFIATKDFSDEGLTHLKKWRELVNLDLSGTQVTDRGIAFLAGCRGLKYLDLTDTLVSDQGLAQIHCDHLTHLALARMQVTDAGLANFHSSRELQNLNLEGLKISDAGLKHFPHSPDLDQLRVTGDLVTDAGLKPFGACTKLTGLHLHGTQLTDDGLAAFQDCKQLVNLNLDKTQITDAGLTHLQNFPDLRQLILIGTKASDAGLLELYKLANLRDLRLEHIKLTESGVATLHEKLPQCRIEWNGGVVEPVK